MTPAEIANQVVQHPQRIHVFTVPNPKSCYNMVRDKLIHLDYWWTVPVCMATDVERGELIVCDRGQG